MHIHILGIAGTFMGGIALIAKQLGHTVSGMDKNIYPPMSHQLQEQNINFIEGYEADKLPDAELYIIGNALSRGNDCVEEILCKHYHYTSGAQWLSDNVLQDKWVVAIAGTHGKTTTAAMSTWILEQAGLNPSYLVGGVMNNFATSARWTDSLFFVIEADEYDTAFFDKRSKFVHYHPNTLVINNLEFDHADIFNSLADIQKQFHHLVRLVPSNGLIIYPENTANIEAVIEQGCWSPKQILSTPMVNNTGLGTEFKVGNNIILSWQLLGQHNANNAISAIMAAQHTGVPIQISVKALENFKNVKRRLEIIYQNDTITLYDDFAHHPTAIQTTLSGLRTKVGTQGITAIVELGSNTMKQGFHQQTLIDSLALADRAYIFSNNTKTSNQLNALIKNLPISIFQNINNIIEQCLTQPHSHIVIMSNSGFGGIVQKLKDSYL